MEAGKAVQAKQFKKMAKIQEADKVHAEEKRDYGLH
jgi:hypothetical protein